MAATVTVGIEGRSWAGMSQACVIPPKPRDKGNSTKDSSLIQGLNGKETEAEPRLIH